MITTIYNWAKKGTTPKFREWSRNVVENFRYISQSKVKENILKLNFTKRLNKIICRNDDYTYAGDGFLTTHYVAFLNDSKFKESYKAAFHNVPLEIQINSNIEWRAHIACWSASRAIHIDGDFVELGVWYGVMSKTMCEYISIEKHLDKKFYLVDSFGEMPGSHMDKSYKEDIFDIVSNRFEKYPNVTLIRGLVPEVLPLIPVKKIAYLAIDMNGSEPERVALEYFYDKVVSGGVIYFDDYGWGYPELRKVVDNFFANKPEELLHFPSGNSIVIKI